MKESYTTVMHPKLNTPGPEIDMKRPYLITEPKGQVIDDGEGTPSIEIDKIPTTIEDGNRYGSADSSDRAATNIPNQSSYNYNSPVAVYSIHRTNFTSLVRKVLKAEEDIFYCGFSLSSTAPSPFTNTPRRRTKTKIKQGDSKKIATKLLNYQPPLSLYGTNGTPSDEDDDDLHLMKVLRDTALLKQQRKRCVQGELKKREPKLLTYQPPLSPYRTIGTPLEKDKDECDLMILLRDTALLKRQRVRCIINKFARGIAEALCQFERAVYTDGESAGSGVGYPIPNYHLVVDPVRRRKEIQIVTEQKPSRYQQPRRQHPAPPIVINQKRKPPNEYHHTHRPDVVAILTLAHSLIDLWRHSLEPNDYISAPPDLDQYQPDDHRIGWVKLTDAVVMDVIRYSDYMSSRPTDLRLGDPSSSEIESEEEDTKRMYVLKEGEMALHLHYIGYPAIRDQWVLLLANGRYGDGREEVENVVRKGIHIVPTSSHRDSLLAMGIVEDEVASQNSDSTIEYSRNVCSIRGRRMRRGEKEQSNLMLDVPMNREKSDDNAVLPSRTSHTPVPTKTVSTRGQHNNQLEDRKLGMTWICTVCYEAECTTQPDSPLVLCEGICARPFHYPCAGLASVPPENKKWECRDCIDRRHVCVVCQEYGDDDEDIHNCDAKSCGLFYHEACLSMYDVDVKLTYHTISIPASSNQTIEQDQLMDGDSHDIQHISGNSSEEKVISRPKFRCPAHYCWTCAGGIPHDSLTPPKSDLDIRASRSYKKKRSKEQQFLANAFLQKKNEILLRCLYCPNTYHMTCIPPFSRYHELALLCHEHVYTKKLPYLDASNSLQAKVKANDDKWRKKMHLQGKSIAPTRKAPKQCTAAQKPFFKDMRGDRVPLFQKKVIEVLTSSGVRQGKSNNLESFCLPCDIQNEVYSKPPKYTHINTNRYYPNHRPKRQPPSGACQCALVQNVGNACDENCLNRMVGTECIGDRNSKLGEKDSYWNCDCGPNCGNRMLGRRQFAKCEPNHELGKGWGLTAVNEVKIGELVQEYVGEIIDEKTKRKRLDLWAQDHPHDPNFYIMQLESGWYIDARLKGNLSRFINHSCEPNCKLVPLNVAGHTRICVISTRRLAPGEFLSYDYQLDTKNSEIFACRCGSSNCKGGANGTNPEGVAEIKKIKKTKKEIWLEAKERWESDRSFLKELANSSKTRLNQVSSSLPGDSESISSSVANGPQPGLATKSRATRICLWRNVIRGSDFYSRQRKLFKSTQRNQTPSNVKRKISKQKLPHIDVLSIMKNMPIT